MDITKYCFIASSLIITVSANYVAEINSAGLKGTLNFTTVSSTVTQVQVNILTAVNSALHWEIRELPTDLARSNRCSDADLSSNMIYNLSTSGLVSSQTMTVQATGLSTSDYAGRSVVLYVTPGGTRHCANILAYGQVTVAEARVSGSAVGGRVRFVQGVSPLKPDTNMVVDLYYTDGSSPTGSAQWKVYRGSVSDSDTSASRCSSLSTVLVDLSASLGAAVVSASPGTNTTSYISSQVTLTGANSAVGNVLGVVQSGSIVACGNIRSFMSKTVRASFDMDGVTGGLTFTQDSPIHATYVQVDLRGLGSNASGYHVHEWPLPRRLNGSLHPCSSAAVAGHWNPFSIAFSPNPGVGTNDEYEIGDLSGKYGTLASLNSHTMNYTDWNLPLFGRYSIIGRSVVVHYAVGGGRWVCTNIGYPSTVVTAVATFRSPVIGRVVMKQDSNMPWDDTTLYTELAYSDNSSPTTAHNMHTHIEPNGNDYIGICQDNKGHYNPYSVAVSGGYSTDCSGSAPERCEIGDITKRTGQLNIGSSANYWARGFWTDEFMPLSGGLSAIGRSLVIHVASGGAPRLACATIYQLHRTQLTTGTWSSSVTGSVNLQQDNPEEDVLLNVNLQYPAGMGEKYHIHELPVPESRSCSSSATAGHFNPYSFNINQSPPPGTGTMDKYEVGDLSGKFGLLTGSSYSASHTDSNLQLFGPLSVAQRSIVVHQPGGARYACASLFYDAAAMSAVELSASATFTGSVQGKISFNQLRYSDGSLGDTSIEVDLTYGNSTVTTGHGWHVHQQPVAGSCASTLAHYNPYNVSLTGDYTTACSATNPTRCELGDLSGKHGLYSIGAGRKLYNDEYLPLEGKFSISGRSVVVHDGALRIACADIVLSSGSTAVTSGFTSVISTLLATIILNLSSNL